jgi:hypothetical protein
MSDSIETEDDAKVLEKIFSSTYDRAVDRKDNRGDTNVTIQLANMFSLPTVTQDSTVPEE